MKNPENKIYLNYNEFNKALKQLFNLEIDKDTICTYMDTYKQNINQYSYKNPLVFTCTYKDETGKGWANIYGRFYKEHTTKKTQIFREFKEFINTYSTTIKKGNKTYYMI